MTHNEFEILMEHLDKTAARIEHHVDEKIAEVNRATEASIRIHAAECPMKDEITKGQTVWKTLVVIGTIIGTIGGWVVSLFIGNK